MKKIIKLALIFSLISLSACVANWKPVEPEAYVKNDGFSIILPKGWLQLESQDKNSVLASIDGPTLQSFVVRQKALSEAFKTTKVEVEDKVLSYELMEYYIAEVKANSGEMAVDVESKEAANISGKDGFKIVFTYKNDKGLRFKQVVYGCNDEAQLYTMTYHAPVLYYFDKNLAEFESSAKTFQVL